MDQISTLTLNGNTFGLSDEKARNDIEKLLAIVNAPGPGVHNSIFRGKDLGSSVTQQQYAAISSGTFDDLYVGDYWTIDGKVYRIAGFDYFFNTGDKLCKKHHAVIVPDIVLYNAQMHKTESGAYEGGASNTTEGGYVATDLYKTGLEQAKATIRAAFLGHILSHRVRLVNVVKNGKPSGTGWFDSEVELMTERMVYGNCILSSASDGSAVPANMPIEKSQLPMFAFRPDMISNLQKFWLQDISADCCFASVSSNGSAGAGGATYSYGVRPYFLIS